MEIPEQNQEINFTPEKSETNPAITDVYLQRHGERGSDGWLTETGVGQVKTETGAIVERYLGPDSPPVTFFILNSPSAAFIEGQPAGRRAEHTGRVSAEVIKNTITERGLDEGKAQLHEFGLSRAGTRAHQRLSEPDYYYVEGADNPTAYFDALVEELGKEGREEGYFAGALEEIRQAVGAESSKEVAERTLKLIQVINRYSQAYHRKYPDRKLVFLLESHGDVIRSTAQHGLGVEASQGWQPQTGESLKLELQNGELSLEYHGMKYEVELGQSRSQ